ncbi:hypothetical protein C8R43DRAFT_80292 [Mycena crocata]|nr:hypothetical protein C8R43DRAFT_80292 [Mycena crocata]
MPTTQDHAPPSPSGSSASDGSSSNSVSTGPPRTPVLTSAPLAMPTFMNFTGEDTINGVSGLGSAGGAKRTSKTTRRVNTAERRATHNAVERQRRETLNGRFLDLAALLSNLNQIRRPSKSAIVNSSIAHLNASRRHRLLAAQQLRMMKHESDALRHEVNEWRSRAGVTTFVDEPMRSEAFGIVIRGELEFEAGDMLDADEGEEEDESATYTAHQYAAEPTHYDEAEEYALLQRQQQARAHAEMLAASAQSQMHGAPFNPPHTAPSHPHAYRQSAVPSAHYYAGSPIIASPVVGPFENPAVGYDQDSAMHAQTHAEAQWAYEKQQQMLHAQQQRQGSW